MSTGAGRRRVRMFMPFPDPRHEGRWAVRWPRPGAARTKSGRRPTRYQGNFKTEKAARDYAREQYAAQSAQPSAERNKNRRRFDVYRNEWLAAYSDPEAARPATYRQYERRSRIVCGTWGSTPVNELDGPTLKAWLRDLRKADGEPYKPATRTAIGDVLTAILNYAVAQGGLPSNPLKATHEPRGRAPKRKDAGGPMIKREDVPTRAQLEALRAAMKPSMRIVVDLMADAGLRPGEARGMHRRDIDFANGELNVVSALDEDGDPDAPTKNEGSIRQVPMTDRLMDRLTEHLLLFTPEGQEAPGPDGLVLADDRGNPARDHTIIRYWNKGRDAAGLPARFTPRSARHYFATTLLGQRVDIGFVATWMGHEPTGRTTRRSYQKVGRAAGLHLREAFDAAHDAENARTMRAAMDAEPADLGE